MSDGRVEIDTSLDTSGIEAGLGKLGSVVGTSAKALAGLGVAGVTATAGLTKSALDAYASYEQLTGGVETLFNKTELSLEEYAKSIGKSAQDAFEEWSSATAGGRIVMNNAEEAFKNAGISANQYMETVTSFSASLISSLGGDTKASAELANTAIIDMSDNANKMGSSMESIQNAYAGFAKQNYTMLDNLKLGYGGTKEEMARLIENANKLREAQGLNADLTIESYADIITAIHTVQDEMGITGTTAKEASTTIEGSINMVKASWQDLLVGIANEDADFEQLIDNFVSSVATAGQNILPRVEQILGGIGQLVEQLAPVIIQNLPKLISDIMPQLVNASSTLIKSVAQTLPQLIPVLVESLIEVGAGAIDGLIEAIPEIWTAFTESMQALVDELGLGFDLEGIFTSMEEIAQGFIDNILPILSAGFEAVKPALAVLMALLDGVLQILADIMNNETVVSLIVSIGIAVATVVTVIKAWTIVQELLNLLLTANPIGLVITTIGALVVAVILIITYIDEVKALIQALWEKVKEVFSNIGSFIVGIWTSIKEGFTSMWNAIVEFITVTIPNKFIELKDGIVQIFVDIKEGIAEKINSIGETIVGIWTSIKEGFQELIDGALEWGKDMIDSFVQGIKDKVKDVKDAVKGVGSTIKGYLGFSEPEYGPLSNFHTFAPDMIDLWCQGVSQNEYKVKNTVEDMAGVINTGINSNDALFSTSDAISGGYGSPIININQQIATVDELADEFNVMNKYGLMRA